MIMSEMKRNTKWIVISFVVGTLLGTGSIWTYMGHRLNEEKYEFEKQKELRYRREDNLKRIMEMSPNIRKKSNEARTKGTFVDENLKLMRAQFKKLIDDFNSDETELAKLESRKPLKFTLEGDFPGGEIIIDHDPPQPPSLEGIKVSP